MYPHFDDYDAHIEYHERCAQFALDMEQAHYEALTQQTEYEQWCWENGQYSLPDEFYYLTNQEHEQV